MFSQDNLFPTLQEALSKNHVLKAKTWVQVCFKPCNSNKTQLLFTRMDDWNCLVSLGQGALLQSGVAHFEKDFFLFAQWILVCGRYDLETTFFEKSFPSRKDLRSSDKIPRMKKTYEESEKIDGKGNAHFLVCPLSESPRGAGYHFYIPGIGRTYSTLSDLNERNLLWLKKNLCRPCCNWAK